MNISRAICILIILVLTAVTASWITQYRKFPYQPYLRTAFYNVDLLLTKWGHSSSLENSKLWFKTSSEPPGVARRNDSQMYGNLTFYCSRHKSEAVLINRAGEVVYEWRKSFSDAWQDPSHVRDVQPASQTGWTGCELKKDGTVYAFYGAQPATVSNHGLIKLNKNSEIVWKNTSFVHHDIELSEGETLLALSYRSRQMPSSVVEFSPELGPALLETMVVKIDTESGRTVDKFSVFRALRRSEYRDIIDEWRDLSNSFNPLHINNLELVDGSFARKYDFVEAGDVVVSARNISALLWIDSETERVVRAQRGRWLFQHDPDLLANGHLMLFDNKGDFGETGRSRLLEIDPSHNGTHWQYDGTRKNPFESLALGAQQQLPNGNILISESRRGRLFEITRSGDIVWSYYHPDRRTNKTGTYIGTFGFGADRFTREELGFIE